MNDYSIKKITADDFKYLIPLMKNCFGDDVNIDYFKWKFLKNPAGLVEGYAAVTENGEFAAYYGVIPESYSIKGETKIIYQSCDTMTHSEHRRKGLFRKLAAHCYDELEKEEKLFIIGFSGEMSTPGFLKFGWIHAFNLKNYFIPRKLILPTPKEQSNVVELDSLESIEQLILNSNKQAEIHSNKTLDVYKWRISNPKHEYKTIAYSSDKGYTAYACYYIESEKLFLFDFNLIDLKGGKQILTELKRITKQGKLMGIISVVQENSIYSTVLKKLNFISNPLSKGPLSDKIPFIYYTVKDQIGDYTDPSDWLVNSFDHDSM
jgi:hypothetical protein